MDNFTAMFNKDTRKAAKLAAERIKAAGFRVLSSGQSAVTVLHVGRTTIVTLDKVDNFIATAAK
jgi:hypothetical protein